MTQEETNSPTLKGAWPTGPQDPCEETFEHSPEGQVQPWGRENQAWAGAN